jgi:DNA primase catalytic subunit
MCSDIATASALGGIRGSLRRVANDLEQQNHAVSALARQVQIANQWQVTAFKLQNERAEWKALSRKTLEALEKEEQVSADLRQQLEQAQNSIAHWKKVGDDRVEATIQRAVKGMKEIEAWGTSMKDECEKEKKVSDDLRQRLAEAQEALRTERNLRRQEFNEKVENYNKLARKYNCFVDCLAAIRARPTELVALVAKLNEELKAQEA